MWGGDDKNRKPNGFIADANSTMYMFYGTPADNWDGSYGFYSTNNGQTWTDTGTRIFGLIADGVQVVGIAQFGPGYTNIPVGIDPSYFYIYLSGRTDGIEIAGQDVYLARVPKASIFTRSAYSYFNSPF